MGHQGTPSAVRDALDKAFVGGSEGQLELAMEKTMAARWNWASGDSDGV